MQESYRHTQPRLSTLVLCDLRKWSLFEMAVPDGRCETTISKTFE